MKFHKWKYNILKTELFNFVKTISVSSDRNKYRFAQHNLIKRTQFLILGSYFMLFSINFRNISLVFVRLWSPCSWEFSSLSMTHTSVNISERRLAKGQYTVSVAISWVSFFCQNWLNSPVSSLSKFLFFLQILSSLGFFPWGFRCTFEGNLRTNWEVGTYTSFLRFL